MVFSSLTFICVFLPVTFLITLVVPSMFAKNLLLAIFSLVFYAYGEPVYVFLMVVSTIANWLFGLVLGHVSAARSTEIATLPESAQHVAVHPSQSAQTRHSTSERVVLIVAVIFNLGLLGFFKYAGMFVQTINTLLGWTLSEPDVSLPIGISFIRSKPCHMLLTFIVKR